MLICTYGCKTDDETEHFNNQKCIDCGKAATHYMGEQWKDYETVKLYYCDDCYKKTIEEYEASNLIADEIWWE